ncbi:hypothetical protein ABZ153_02835 [Streptomyces sp. NPDC006290]|jgi:ribose/xylose/arabinose/galactoside ABC-type transport system permease subunit|uniref:hypothetical protein n=1 Tax=Streptomyces sp. NPDC006290 TaxID=3156745 RepID=UPI0033BDF52A
MSSLLYEASHILAAGVPAPSAGVPQPAANAPGALTSKVNTVLGIAAWAGTAAGVAGVLITGAMMAVSVKRGESSEHMSRLGMVLGGCVLVATAGPLISFVFA